MTKMSHALLIPLPAQGHINPMMQLAWKMVSDGFLVTFLNSDYNHQRIMETNAAKSLDDNCDMIRLISVPFALSPEECRNNPVNFLKVMENNMGPCVIDKVIQEINEKEVRRITCIVADVWTCFGLKAVARFHGVPLVAFHSALVSLCAIRRFSSRLVSHGVLSSDGFAKEVKEVKYLPFLPPLSSGELPWLYAGEYGFRKGIQMTEEIKEIDWVLFNSFYEIEAPVVDVLSKELSVYPIGPLIPSEFLEGDRVRANKVIPSLWADNLECLQWLDKQSTQSVIYVSFGSIAAWGERYVEELALGLEATQRPFLWVVRSDLMDGRKADFPTGFLERVTDRGCIVSWAPQLEVLSHPSIACFVTHCGWNSSQESITMGVPMLCCPYFADQFLNRRYIVDVWKVGLPLNPNNEGIIEKAEFTRAVETLLVGEEGLEIRKEVRKLKRIARDAVKEGGTSYNNYNSFVNAMKNTT
uniref:Glycosyltransferase n=1 Tax=Araucaria cunninghamii TaxID=56994 RepID=A0A0D6QVJ3_ARACU